MEKLLAAKGISTVTYTDGNDIEYKYVYTDQLLALGILVELYEIEREEDDEEVLEEGRPQYETCLTACLSHKKDSYEFTILFDTRPYVPTIYLYRTILDLIEIIENSDAGSLLENLKHAASASLSSQDLKGDEDLQKDFREKVTSKIKHAMQLIEQSKKQAN